MIIKIKQIVAFITITCVFSCKQAPDKLTSITPVILPVDAKYPSVDSISTYIAPYKNRIDEVLDSTLAYAPFDISKTDGQLNTTAGNLLADVVYHMANPIFKKRTSNSIDGVLLNHGGIRSVISKGNVSARTAYEVMPFENTIEVVALKGEAMQQLFTYLATNRKAHPIHGFEILLSANGGLQKTEIQNKPFDTNKTYFIATSNYLANGGDAMIFFKTNEGIFATDYLIRNALIDYFTKVDSLQPKIDNRFTQTHN